jgi:signal transduction histidine kinase
MGTQARASGPLPNDRRLRRWLAGQPSWLQAALDLSGLLVVALTFAQAGDPDFLFHVVWVVLAIEAFVFGLRVTALRITVATAFLIAYELAVEAKLVVAGAPLAPLEFSIWPVSEWPLMVVISIIVAVMADRLAETGRRYAALYRRANDRLLSAQEQERRRLARDLHDGVGQTLTALTLTLDAAESLLWAGPQRPPEHARAAIRRAQELAAAALEETRGVAFQLRPARLHETGLVAAIQELARMAGRRVDVVAEPALIRLGLLAADAEVEAYRIVQEALGNALRHAAADRIAIEIGRAGERLVVRVVDDGVGFDPSRAEGLGLPGMRERAAAIGAVLAVASRPGHGTTVTLSIPLSGDGRQALAEAIDAAPMAART